MSLILLLLLVRLTAVAQLQWYQNQDGNNPAPYGTYATSAQAFNTSSFIACYLWRMNNDEYTWKISKTHFNGTELKSFYITGTTAMAEAKVIGNKAVYVLKKNYPIGLNPEYVVYKLSANLDILGQRTISFPNGFNIINLNAFELDEDGNVYFAGDGQYPDGPGYSPASFVLKTDKNLAIKWSRMDSSLTAYTKIHIDKLNRVTVVADYYEYYPDVKIIRISANGLSATTITVRPDASRYNLYSALDKTNNLLLYGDKSVGDTAQAMYLCKVSLSNGHIFFRKTYYTTPGMQLNDLRMDNEGRIFSLVTQYVAPGNQLCRISRISPANGQVLWNRVFPFAQDSCLLVKLVINADDRFYAVGEKRSCNFFAKGFAVQMKKNGQLNANMPAPDSVAFQRTHTLVDGIMDNNDQLIAIGNTNDFDTGTYNSTYFRAFATRFNPENNCVTAIANDAGSEKMEAEQKVPTEKLVIYPNPVQSELIANNPSPAEYDRLTVYDMRGATLLQQVTRSSNTIRVDISSLGEGVYLLVLRASATGKEISMKFVVRK